ncbi:hypothetical protein LC085_11415 [Bacillus tianshenii]|uniref:hypothetical protein n=1 Tax=Sutcliffiella tianshenii TaxID=1463404 RepID=UPI001CD7CC60|nr:hypothetical protein [Bacillus tianshenii]MCA1320520.1 hypothetical protein [Bacillus tianshenii]
MKHKLIIGSPIHQKPSILNYFLESLSRINIENLDLHYVFIDDNESQESKEILYNFSQTEKNVNILSTENKDNYLCNEETHYWREELVWKVAGYKDIIIEIAKENDCDYLFLIDSDIVLHPNTIQQLIKAEKDIISNIFWTKWKPHLPELPQVWMHDYYEQYSKKRGEIISGQEKTLRHLEFLETLRQPGIFEVGGLGACTLISKSAINSGVNFKEIRNLSLSGEDRHFCVRAQAMGFNLYVDTHSPAFHLYRDSDLERVDNYISRTTINSSKKEFIPIIKCVTEGIEMLGTTHRPIKDNLKNYFTQECFGSISKDSNKLDKEENIEATVYDVKLERMECHQKLAVVSFLLKNKGYVLDQKIFEEFICEAWLIKEDNNWLIDEIKILDNLQVIS